MSTIKYHDGEKWVVAAGSDAKNINLENELLQDADTTSISVERGFQKLNNKISKLEHNLAWIYLNGAKGGGGGGGGGSTSYTITVENNQSVFYTTSDSLSFKIQIDSGGVRKQFKIYAQNITSGAYIVSGTQSVYSQSYSTITLPNLKSDCTVALWAIDSNDNYTTQITIQVKVGAINITQIAQPGTIYYVGETATMYGTFSIRNKTGNPIKLVIFSSTNADPLANGEEPLDTIEIQSSSTFANYQIDYSQFIDPNVLNKTYTFKVCAYSEFITIGENQYFRSDYFTNSIQTASGNNLTIITSNIATTTQDATNYGFSQGGACRVPIIFSYRYVTVNTFYYQYKVYYQKETTPVYTSSVGSVIRNTPTIIQFQLGDWAVTEGYYRVEIIGNSSQDFTGSLSATTNVYFVVTEASIGDLKNYKGALAFNYGSFNQPDTNSDICTYVMQDTGDYAINRSQFPRSQGINSTTLTIHNNTGSTGFQVTSDNVNYINLSGNTYATIDEFAQLLSQTDNYQYTLLGNGFYFQFTYKYTQSNPVEQTILSLGTYQNNKLLNGFEVTSEHILIKVGALQEEIDAPVIGENQYASSSEGKTEQITVGLNCWVSDVRTSAGTTIPTYYFAIYLDGIMTKCLVVPEQELGTNWAFGNKLYLGCRSDLTQQANCYIYDIRFYANRQPALSLVYNFISAIEQANLKSGIVDSTLDSNLRKKNFFSNTTDTCLLCGDDGEYTTASEILATLSNSYSTYELDYPIIYLEETSQSSEMYRIVKTTNWTKDSTEIKQSWPVRIHIFTKYGELVVDGDNNDQRPNISIQGTSTLAYNVKNFELKIGQLANGTERLLKINGWLPENEFTLKADVVDSSHANNTVIGKWINQSGYFSEMSSTIDPNMLSQDINIRNKRKFTSEGFPCLVFIKYANGGSGAEVINGISTGRTDFYGVYNFNLGRYAYHNLNLRILDSYVQDSELPDDQPQVITDYQVRINPTKNIYSLEVEDNFGDDWALFQQAHRSITEYMFSNRSFNDLNNAAYDCITQTLMNQLAISYKANEDQRIPKKAIDANDEPYNITDAQGHIQYWTPGDAASTNKEALGTVLNVDCFYKYLITALVFGMVDSTCKNMVARTWNAQQVNGAWEAIWYLCFYDMDSSMMLNNAGSQIVPYDVHLNRYYNVTQGSITSSGDSRNTGVDWNIPVDNSNSLKTYGGISGNRLWDIIRSYDQIGTASEETLYVGDYYWQLRQLIPDPEKFIDEYFAAYINKTGAILYNYDYEQKYVSYGQIWDATTQSLVSNTSNKQASFLYGTRLNSIRTWFKKRINFLDSVYFERYKSTDTGVRLSGYFTSSWGARQTTPYTQTSLTLTGAQKYKIRYTVSSGGTVGTRTLWVSEEPQNVTIQTQANSNNTVTLEGWDGIIDIPQFYTLGFVGITQPYKFEMLRSLNNQNLTIDGLSGNNSLKDCPSLISVNFSGVKLNETVSLDLSSNLSIKNVDISNSDFASLTLSENGSVEEINMTDAANIRVLPTTINGQSGLKTLLLQGTSITELELRDLPSLQTLTLPVTVQKLTIQNCGISNIEITWNNSSETSHLEDLTITDCEKLSYLNIQGQNNLNNLILLRCPNITSLNFVSIRNPNNKHIDLAGTHANASILDLDGLTKLQTLNLSGCQIFTKLNLTASEQLNFISCQGCQLEEVICANNYVDGSGEGEDNPIELASNAFRECTVLTTLKGYFLMQGSQIFYNCANLEFDNLLNLGDLILRVNAASLEYSFYGCTKFTSGIQLLNFIHNLPSNEVSNLSYAFAQSGLNFELSSTQILFEVPHKYDGINNIAYMFQGTNVRGSVFSETSEKDGFFTNIPNVKIIEGLFASTSIQYIDNDVFHFAGMENITNMDYIFQNCGQLKCIQKCVNGETDPTLSNIHSRTLFNKITSKIGATHGEYISSSSQASQPKPNWIWPYGVFKGVNAASREIPLVLEVDLDESNKPYLFNTSIQEYKDKMLYLDNSLYDGLQFTINWNLCDYSALFKKGTRVTGSETQYIPIFVRITSPFSGTSKMTINFNTDNSFFDSTIISLYSPFSGAELQNTTSIPIKFFDGCTNLQTAQYVFSNIGLNNVYFGEIQDVDTIPPKRVRNFIEPKEVYTFQENGIGLFDSCTSLQDITGIFYGNTEFRMQLYSGMFRNCKLKNVNNAFAYSRVIGTIPEQLFLSNGFIQNMQDVFQGCYNIGYNENYEYAIYPLADNQWTSWNNHIPLQPGLGRLLDCPLPYDFFHYCDVNPNISNVLGSLFWYEQGIVEGDLVYGNIYDTELKGGLTGKIPVNIFEGSRIIDSSTLTYVFANTMFEPENQYVPNSYQRAELYPPIFRHTPNLSNLTGMFANTNIPATHKINSDLFVKENGTLLPITNLSYCWYNCEFHPFINMNAQNSQGQYLDNGSAQLEDQSMFDNMSGLNNIEYMFAGTPNGTSGLQWPSVYLFNFTTFDSTSLNVNGTFAYAHLSNSRTGRPSIPTLNSVPSFVGGRSYLQGLQKESIANVDNIPIGLWPQAWLNEE